MKRLLLWMLVVVVWPAAWAAPAIAPEVAEVMDLVAGRLEVVSAGVASQGYSVVVESKTVETGDTFEVGIYLENATPIRSFTIPLVIRTVSGWAYMTALAAEFVDSSRLNGYLNGLYQGVEIVAPIITTRPTPLEEPDPRHGPGFGVPVGSVDFKSPDGILFARHRVELSNYFPPGTDGLPGQGVPSIRMTIAANQYPGQFEIDTTFFTPSNHIGFLTDGPLGSPIEWILPEFSKGIVTVTGSWLVQDPQEDTSVAIEPDPPADTLPDPGTAPDSTGIVVVDTTDDLVEPGIDTSSVVVIDPPSEDEETGQMPVKGVPGGTTVGGRLVTKDPLGPSGLETAPLAKVLCYPNPFNSSMTARYGVAEPGDVSVGIYNILGQPVAQLYRGHRDAGEYFIEWDGASADGAQAPTGMYLLRVQTGGGVSVSKVMLLR